MCLDCFNLTLKVVVSILSTIVGVSANVLQSACNNLNLSNPLNFMVISALSLLSLMIRAILTFICGTFQFSVILNIIVSPFNAIFTAISSLKYVYSFFETHFLSLVVHDTKRTVLLLLFVVIVSQIWKMRHRRLAFESELKSVDQRKKLESNSTCLGFSGTSWKSGSFEGELPNFTRVSCWESGDFNRILDFALRELCHRCRGNISVGPISFTDKVPILQTDWLLTAEDCVLSHLDTAHRVGSATTSEEPGGVLVLDATIGLRKLKVRAVNYFAHVVLFFLPSVRASGKFVGTVESLSLRAKVALKSPFAAELRSLRITNMGPPQVHITGLGTFSNFLWNMLQSTILSKERLENYLKPIFEGVLQDLTSHVSAIPTTQQIKTLPWEATLTRDEQIKAREVTIVQTMSYESRPRETVTYISQYQNEGRPTDTASTFPWDQNERYSSETTSTSPWNRNARHSTETSSTHPWNRNTRRSRGAASTFPWDSSEEYSTETSSTFPWDRNERRSQGTASTFLQRLNEDFPREVTTIQTIRDYERNTRERRELRLATAQEGLSRADAVAIGVTVGVATGIGVAAIFGITSAIVSSRSSSRR